MINWKDYKQYISENKELLDILKNNSSILYTRVDDCINVLNQIADKAEEGNFIDEYVETIFEVGFSYVHEQIELIKIYFYDYFKRDYILFKQYELGVDYILHIEDICESLDEGEYLNEERRKVFSKLSSDLENVIQNRLTCDEAYINKIELRIESILPKNYNIYTTQMIFEDILEEVEKFDIIGEDD